MMVKIVGVFIFFMLSTILTLVLRKYALKNNIIDTPNSRSSHITPTPRGGGVAIVVSFLCGIALFYFQGYLPLLTVIGLVVSGGVIALVGFWDDHGHIAARWRLLAHFSAAAFLLFCLGGFPVLIVSGVVVNLGILGNLFGLLFLVWMLNLYNFMDGIDGLASAQAVTTSIGAIVIYFISGYHVDLSSYLVLGLLASTVLGFLLWNFPPAKIFMGDAGSGFLGLIIGSLAISAGWIETKFFFCWLILLGLFIVDATWTLVRRVISGFKVYEAHRSHGYQILSRRFKGHLPVTLSAITINIIWLFPIALLVGIDIVNPIIGLIISYIPLLFVDYKFNAGVNNE
ncbi:glycosyl transferase [Yersinia kristensenii]|uniref:Glycosyl transferase n=2 Tax=Yersinia kristensenii TaxID=28152 RepID=A0A0T9L853_YERKR|nr:glycosyltransferase family 4 protein [Yersinia kristensenii]MDR4899283.1 glycosyltransferase family 4 protein [Yersinia kristensenii]OVZ81965.1 glycosyl transferase [Yersinia kristensenii]CFR10868.1 polyprenol phosphate:N-acetyl-hexosamine 1-phosphate transferase [Yersinia kristensenii]CNE66708.1 polyprenol phosphate:N-acetyl-hexosamine 1-phosphate transferase [Yersinia kristensenii]